MFTFLGKIQNGRQRSEKGHQSSFLKFPITKIFFSSLQFIKVKTEGVWNCLMIFLFTFVTISPILTKLSQIVALMSTTIWPSLVKIGLKTKKIIIGQKVVRTPFLKNNASSSIIMIIEYELNVNRTLKEECTVFSSLKHRYLIIVYLLLKIRVSGEKKSILIKFFHQQNALFIFCILKM